MSEVNCPCTCSIGYSMNNNLMIDPKAPTLIAPLRDSLTLFLSLLPYGMPCRVTRV